MVTALKRHDLIDKSVAIDLVRKKMESPDINIREAARGVILKIENS